MAELEGHPILVVLRPEDLHAAFASLLPFCLQDPRWLPAGDGTEGELRVDFGPLDPVGLVTGFFARLVRASGNSNCFFYAYHLVSRIPVAMDGLLESGLHITTHNVMGVIVGLLTLLYKSVEDESFLNKDIVPLFGGALTLRQLNAIETRVFLLLVRCPNRRRLLFTL